MSKNTDKADLSANRRRERTGYRETPDVSAAVCRLVRAIGKRTAEGDPEDLAELLKVADAVQQAMRTAVDGLREVGRSDSEIGRVLGVTKQAVAQRFPREDGPNVKERAEVNCSRCDRVYRGRGDWNVTLDAGRVVGLLCPACQTPAENAEAAINEATLEYGQDALGRVVAKPKNEQ